MKTISDLYHSGIREDRRTSYPPFDREAEVECTILGALRTLASNKPRHVFLRRLIMKIIREWHSPKLDNLVDIIGYVECHYERFKDLYDDPALVSKPTSPPAANTTPAQLDVIERIRKLIEVFPLPSPPIPIHVPFSSHEPRQATAIIDTKDRVTYRGSRDSIDDFIALLRLPGVTADITEFERCWREIERYRLWRSVSDDRDRPVRFVGCNDQSEYVSYAGGKSGRNDISGYSIERLIIDDAGHLIYRDDVDPDPVEHGLNQFWLWSVLERNPSRQVVFKSRLTNDLIYVTVVRLLSGYVFVRTYDKATDTHTTRSRVKWNDHVRAHHYIPLLPCP